MKDGDGGISNKGRMKMEELDERRSSKEEHQGEEEDEDG